MMYFHEPIRLFLAQIQNHGLQERVDVGRRRGATFPASRAQGYD